MADDRATGLPRRSQAHWTPAHERVLERLKAGGTSGNERLTAATGVLLIVGLFVLGITIVRIGQLLWLHLFLGMALVAPVVLKLASTGYRFVRYYSGTPAYVRKGPPPPALRLLAPLVVLTTLCVFATGVGLLLIGPGSRGTLLPIHKISFFVWLGAMSLHVLGHLGDTSRALSPGRQGRRRLAGGAGRGLSLAGAVVGGVLLATAVIPQFSPWLNHPHGSESRIHERAAAALDARQAASARS